MSTRLVARTDISDIDKAAEETEIERAASRQLIQEGRLIRTKELERRRRETGSTNASVYSSPRSSVEPSSTGSSVPRSSDIREYRMQIHQLEEKFKGTMMANVQLDNDKQLLRYEVDLLKDQLEDLKDSNNVLQRAFTEKKRDLAYHRMQVAELNHRLEFARQQIEARDQLLIEHDLVLLGSTNLDASPPLSADERAAIAAVDDIDGNTKVGLSANKSSTAVNGLREVSPFPSKTNGTSDETLPSMAIISKATSALLSTLPESKLDAQILHLFGSRSELSTRVEKLEAELEVERKREPEYTSRFESRFKMNAPHEADLKQDLQNLRSQIQEHRYKLQEASQKNCSLESDIVRLEGQAKRYKMIADTCEQQENELKLDRRKCQRELRDTQTSLDDAKSEISRLQRKLDKFSRGSVAPLPGSSLRGFRESSLQR